MSAGPSGPPPAGPSGPSPTGPPGSPQSAPSGRPPSGPPGRPPSGPPARRKDTKDDGAFEHLATLNEARRKELERRDKSVTLKKNRSAKRMNVILMFLLAVIFGAAALWPISYGDISRNPHQAVSENEIINLHDTNHPMTWEPSDVVLMEKKIWDGGDQFTGSFQYDLFLPGIPIAIDGITTVPVKIKIVSYRTDGASTSYRIGLFPDACDSMLGHEINELVDSLKYGSVIQMKIGEPEEVRFDVPAGRYCVVFEYIDPPLQEGWKATIDAEISPNWRQPLLAPLAVAFAVLAVFALVGATKAGKAWKAVAQPEVPDQKTAEEQVLEAAEDERGAMSETEQSAEQESEQTADQQAVEEAASVPSGPPAELTQQAVEPEPEPEPQHDAEESEERDYTDEELSALGWTAQQIEWHRQAEAQQAQAAAQPAQQEYTDEQLAGFGWTTEQIAAYRQQQQ